MKYNSIDNVFYCTAEERAALDVATLMDTAKYYEVDTKGTYIVYDGAWYAM